MRFETEEKPHAYTFLTVSGIPLRYVGTGIERFFAFESQNDFCIVKRRILKSQSTKWFLFIFFDFISTASNETRYTNLFCLYGKIKQRKRFAFDWVERSKLWTLNTEPGDVCACACWLYTYADISVKIGLSFIYSFFRLPCLLSRTTERTFQQNFSCVLKIEIRWIFCSRAQLSIKFERLTNSSIDGAHTSTTHSEHIFVKFLPKAVNISYFLLREVPRSRLVCFVQNSIR